MSGTGVFRSLESVRSRWRGQRLVPDLSPLVDWEGFSKIRILKKLGAQISNLSNQEDLEMVMSGFEGTPLFVVVQGIHPLEARAWMKSGSRFHQSKRTVPQKKPSLLISCQLP